MHQDSFNLKRTSPAVHFVCTGNICRSPFAERLLAHLMPQLRVTSSGIDAPTGSPMDSFMAERLISRKGDPTEFYARSVMAEDMNADLILTMSHRQRQFLLDEFPSSARRLGLLGNATLLSRLRAEHPDAPLPDLIAEWSCTAPDSRHEIPDPYRRGPEAADLAAARIAAAVDRLVPVLTGGLTDRG